MAETDFIVRYGGPGISEGRINVRDLAPSLLALGEVFYEANRIVNPGGVDVALEIVAAADGSFAAHMILSHVDLGDAVDLFSGDAATAIIQFKELIIGTGIGLFFFIKKMRGRNAVVEQVAASDPGYVRVTTPDGTSMEVPSKVLDLYGSASIRRNARSVIRPLDGDEIDAVEFIEDSTVTVSVGNEDVQAFDTAVSEIENQGPEQLLNEGTSDMALTIARLPLAHPDDPWRFDDGDREFQAAMLDEAFKGRVESGVEAFRAGDTLLGRVRLRQYQNTETGRRRNEWSVLEVREHRAFRPPEPHPILPIEFAADDGSDEPLAIEPPSDAENDGDQT